MLTSEVARLRAVTGSSRTASTAEVERLRALQTELRQLEVAAGRMTPQQAEKAAAEDRVTLLRAEQNVLRTVQVSAHQRGETASAISRSAELQRQIDVATGKITPEQARQRGRDRAAQYADHRGGSGCAW